MKKRNPFDFSGYRNKIEKLDKRLLKDLNREFEFEDSIVLSTADMKA